MTAAPEPPEYRYHLLRAATERFGRDPSALDGEELAQAARQAGRTFELESLVLATPEARDTRVPESRVDSAVAQLRARYADAAELARDLDKNGLDLDTLARALRRELTFDAVMHRVGARHAAVDEIDARLFYELHPERFARPERRTARHILITVNDDYPENRREAARSRIERIAEALKGAREGLANRFGELARKHSECPTAFEHGRLGDALPGQLYSALDAALFALAEGTASGPVESDLGFHLLYCERIHPPVTQSFAAAREAILAFLTERQRLNCQKAWLAELKSAAGRSANVQAATAAQQGTP